MDNGKTEIRVHAPVEWHRGPSGAGGLDSGSTRLEQESQVKSP